MANLTNSSNIIDEINSKLTNPEGGSDGQVLTMTGGVEAWGPAPEGFHVPSKEEWETVFNAGVALGQWSSSNGDGMRIKLKLPFAGERNNGSSSVESQGSDAYYWSSTAYSDKINSYFLSIYSNGISTQYNSYRACGFSVRAFRNSPLAPNASWTTIYAGSNGAGIFHNASEGVISISSDGQTWITIADKNLGATTVYNDGDELSEANCGKYYQWGNNYGFPWTGTISKTSPTIVDASAYGKGNPYSSDTFITNSYWDRSNNKSLWGMEEVESKPQWKDIEALPEGGTAGQVLTKTDDGAEWSDKKLIFEIESNIINFNRIDHNLSETLEFADEDMAIIQKAYEEYKKGNNVKLRIKDTSQQEGPFNEVRYHDLDIVSIEEQDEIPGMDRKRVDIKGMYGPHYYFLMNCVLVDGALRGNVIYFKSLDSDIIPEKYYENNKYAATYNNTMYVITSDATYSDIKYIAKGPIKVSVGSGDVKYSDFNFVQLSGSSVELSISSAIEPTSNFTINAPEDLKEGLIYTLRVKNGNTAYKMTLGDRITNPGDTDVTLTPNAIDQFVFLAVDGVLELQPEAGGGGGSVTPEEFNDLKDKVDELELAKDPNVTVVGTPTILQGNISNFDTNSYLIAPFLSSFSNNPFVLHMDIATGADVTTQQNIVDSVYGLAVAIKDGKFLIALSTNGTSWNIGQFEGAYTVLPNTDYHVEVEWTGSDFTLKYSTDGTSYTTDIATTLTTALSGKPLYFGGFGATSHPFKGTFNFNEWYFLSNGNKVWMGMDSVGLETRANVSLSNLDEEGEKKLLPSGGTEGQVLTKTATGTGWEDPSGGNNTVYVTQEEYDALTPKENVDYVIYGDGTEDGYVTESMLETALSGKVSSSSVSVIVDAGSSLPTNPDSKTLYLITS